MDQFKTLILFLFITLNFINTESSINCHKRSEKLKFVTVHFYGRTSDGLKIESTYDKGIPIEFQLGVGMVFQGLDEGVEGMCLGEKRNLTIHPSKAIKKRGKQKPELPKDKTLVYEVELIDVSDFATLNAFNWFDSNSDGKLSEDEAMELISMTFEPSPQFPMIDEKKMLDLYMNMHDSNKDGLISTSEYLASSEKAHKMKVDKGTKANIPDSTSGPKETIIKQRNEL